MFKWLENISYNAEGWSLGLQLCVQSSDNITVQQPVNKITVVQQVDTTKCDCFKCIYIHQLLYSLWKRACNPVTDKDKKS